MPYEEADMKKQDEFHEMRVGKELLEQIAELKSKNFSLNLRVESLLAQIERLERGQDEAEGPTVPGADILLDAYALITGPRQAAYAHPTEDYTKVTEIFSALTGIRLSLEQGILFMVAIKLARLRTNIEAGQMHWDSLVDAAGYLGCLGMVSTDLDPWAPYYERPSSDE